MHPHHIRHTREYLARVREGQIATPDPEAVYLGGEDEGYLWELFGLRLSGMPLVTLAALRFQLHDFPGIHHARESLASYLSSPPAPDASGEVGLIPARLPSHREAIPAFLKGLRAGRDGVSVSLDPHRIEVAFDFRMRNPSALGTMKQAAGSPRSYLIRTADGHVLRGQSNGLGAVGLQPRFIALKDPDQLIGSKARRMPTLIVNRSFIAMCVDITEETTRMSAAHWVPFLGTTANPVSVLPLPDGAERSPGQR